MFEWARNIYGLKNSGDPIDQFMVGWIIGLGIGLLFCIGAIAIDILFIKH